MQVTCASESMEMKSARTMDKASGSWRNQESILPMDPCVSVAGVRSGEGLGGSGTGPSLPPNSLLRVSTSLCRPQSCGLL